MAARYAARRGRHAAAVGVERHRTRPVTRHLPPASSPVRVERLRGRHTRDGRHARAAGPRRPPARERVARTRRRGKRLQRRADHAVPIVVRRHAPAVRVECDAHRLGPSHPHRVERHDRAVLGREIPHRRAIDIRHLLRLCLSGRQRPPRERVAAPRKRARPQVLRLADGDGLVVHDSRAAVGVEADGIAHPRPHGVEVHDAVLHLLQVHHAGVLGVADLSARRGGPPGERETRPREPVRGQRLPLVKDELLVLHPPRAAVRVEPHVVLDRLPVREQLHVRRRNLGCLRHADAAC